jgi:hypothetical protein
MLIKDHLSYVKFFRTMATYHKAIRHSETHQAFARMNLSAHPVLAREDIEEFLKGMKSRLNFPALLVNAPSGKFSHEDSNDAKRKLINGEFFVLNRYQKDDWDGQEAVFDDTTAIGNDIMAFLGEYYEEHPQEGYFQWEEGMEEKISNLNIDNLAGVKFYFTISIPYQTALNLNPDAFDPALFED